MKRLCRFGSLLFAIAAIFAAGAAGPAPEPAIEARLESLDPEAPMEYFRLAEDLAYGGATDERVDLARTLFVLAYELDRRGPGGGRLGASVALALADLARTPSERRWLLAMASALDPRDETVDWSVSMGASGGGEARFALAEALGLYRAGEYRRSLDRLETPGATALLERYSPALSGGAAQLLHELETEPTCRECRNRRVVVDDLDEDHGLTLCYTCGGDPGPDLSDAALVEQLRVEAILLQEGQRGSWASEFLIDQARPMTDLEPERLAPRYGVDPDKPLWRDGRWTGQDRPASETP